MHVRVFVTECTMTTAKQSVCLNVAIETAITSGSPNVCGEDNKYATLIFIINNARIGYIKCIAFIRSGRRTVKKFGSKIFI